MWTEEGHKWLGRSERNGAGYTNNAALFRGGHQLKPAAGSPSIPMAQPNRVAFQTSVLGVGAAMVWALSLTLHVFMRLYMAGEGGDLSARCAYRCR